MPLGVATAILLVLGASALRDEIDRLALQAMGNAGRWCPVELTTHLLPRVCWYPQCRFHSQFEWGRGRFEGKSLVQDQWSMVVLQGIASCKAVKVLSNESCRDGVLHVKGAMVVKEELVFSQDCGHFV
eukprot:Skav220623  [mRNA]  locus=scaffold112:116653:118225:+ [translate_table: standard]